VKNVSISELTDEHQFSPVSPIWHPGGPVTLSPTHVADYLNCPALYLFKHVHKLDPPSLGERRESLGYKYGLLAHRVLERWDYRDRGMLIASVDDLSERDIPQDLRENLKAHLVRFTGSDLYNVIAGSEEIRKEEPFAFLHENILVRGVMDVKIRTGNRVAVIDFKTDSGEGESSENLFRRYKMQMGLYALAVRNAEDIVPSRLALHFLTRGVTQDFPCSGETINGISRLLSKTITSLDEGDFGPNRTEHCAFCPWFSLCRIYFG
jgi:CRISPR/Cas system-associated exonuclease Cas4 (RecB family)